MDGLEARRSTVEDIVGCLETYTAMTVHIALITHVNGEAHTYQELSLANRVDMGLCSQTDCCCCSLKVFISRPLSIAKPRAPETVEALAPDKLGFIGSRVPRQCPFFRSATRPGNRRINHCLCLFASNRFSQHSPSS